MELKKEFPSVTIMAGNVCTKAGFEFLCKAGADCILIHSKEKTPNQIFSFAKIFNKTSESESVFR